MGKALEIDLRLKGLAGAVQGLNQLAGRAGDTEKSIAGLSRSLRTYSGLAQSLPKPITLALPNLPTAPRRAPGAATPNPAATAPAPNLAQLAGLLGQLRAVSAAYQKATAAATAFNGVVSGTPRLALATPQRAAPGQPPATSPGRSRLPAGPEARLAAARQRLQTLQAAASTPAETLRDARGDVARLQRAVTTQNKLLNPAAPPSWMNKLGSLLGTSRVNLPGPAGTGLSPLLGKLADLAPGGVMGDAISGVSGLGLAAVKLGQFTLEAAENVRAFSSARSVSGGSAQEVAGLQGMGIPLQQIADMAQSFRERTGYGGDPMAISAARQLGVQPQMPRIWGGANEAKGLSEALNRLRQVAKDSRFGATEEIRLERQLTFARALGLESMLEQLRVSDAVWAANQRDAAQRAGMMDQKTIQSARDLGAQWVRLGRSLDTLKQSATSPLFAPMARDIGALANTVNNASKAIADSGNVIKGIYEGNKLAQRWTNPLEHLKMLTELLGKIPGVKLPDWLKEGFGGIASNDAGGGNAGGPALSKKPFTTFAQDWINPTAETLAGLSAIPNGIYGGGKRAQEAVPPKLMDSIWGQSDWMASKGASGTDIAREIGREFEQVFRKYGTPVASNGAGNGSEFESAMNGRSLALGAWNL